MSQSSTPGDAIGSGARADVLAFYRELPFNFRTDAELHASELRRADPLQAYPPLVHALAARPRLLDVGSGTGWLANAAAYHHRCRAAGIDFNPVAIERAREIAKLLGLNVEFNVANLFEFSPADRFDIVTSIGVLHHTDNCLGGIAHIGKSLVSDNGRMFIGLYHTFGRRSFLAHFEQMKRSGVSQEAMYAAFRGLRTGGGAATEDDTFMRSWFRDQVLHPHETCHTLAEILPILDDFGFTLESTSINRFAPLPDDRGLLVEQEKTLGEAGQRALAEGRYFPGFFVFMARRKFRS